MFTNITNSTFCLIKSVMGYQYKTKHSIIDPLTCMIRLAILSFKPIGTKISIVDNRIKYNDPSVLQGPIRWTQGDNRDDLHNLYGPITKAIEWYDVSCPKIKHIFQLGSLGISILMESYTNNSTVNHSLEYYKTIIDYSISGNKTDVEFDEENKIYKELKNLWNTNEITIINDILNEIKNKETDETECLIKAIDSIIYIKEKRVKGIIDKNTTVL